MQFLIRMVALLLCIFSSGVWANECLVSTTPRALFSDYEQLDKERMESETGKYSATFKNGNSVLAQFDLCDLGIKASYLIKNDSANYAGKINFLLAHTVPSKVSIDVLISQVADFSEVELRDGVALKGSNGNHWVQVKESPSPLYSAVIHYRWIPPAH
ncbi:hypothetical protein [Microbulbifer agarilyticus]